MADDDGSYQDPLTWMPAAIVFGVILAACVIGMLAWGAGP